jgi:hypothetical protein
LLLLGEGFTGFRRFLGSGCTGEREFAIRQKSLDPLAIAFAGRVDSALPTLKRGQAYFQLLG